MAEIPEDLKYTQEHEWLRETSDGYHMTAMHPEGLGAALAMRHALARADMRPQHVDYINLHGTATPANDAGPEKPKSLLGSLFGMGGKPGNKP